jgi:hypothetical protein
MLSRIVDKDELIDEKNVVFGSAAKKYVFGELVTVGEVTNSLGFLSCSDRFFYESSKYSV